MNGSPSFVIIARDPIKEFEKNIESEVISTFPYSQHISVTL